MSAVHSEEIAMLRDTVARVAAERDRRDFWAHVGALGWLGVPVAEEAGGIGLGVAGAAALQEEFGRQRLDLPYLSCVIAPAGLLEAAPGGAAALAALIAGERRIAAPLGAFLGGGGAGGPLVLEGGSLSGSAGVIVGLDEADQVLLPFRDRMLLLDLDRPGLSRESAATIDGRSVGTLRLDGLVPDEADWLSPAEPMATLCGRIGDRLRVVAAADTLGIIRALYAMTLDHVQTRRQFGRAIGEFQTIQFRMVDLWIALEEVRCLVPAAVAALEEGRADAATLARAAWVRSLQCGRRIVEEAIQLHGAIGMTAEWAGAGYVTRFVVSELLVGPAGGHLPRAALSPLAETGR